MTGNIHFKIKVSQVQVYKEKLLSKKIIQFLKLEKAAKALNDDFKLKRKIEKVGVYVDLSRDLFKKNY